MTTELDLFAFSKNINSADEYDFSQNNPGMEKKWPIRSTPFLE